MPLMRASRLLRSTLLGGPVAGSAYEAEAVTLFAAMTPAPDDTRKGHINTLIAGLKADTIWTKLDALWVMAAHDAQASLLNWKNPGTFDLIGVNSPTFAVDQGYTGDGSSSRLRTQFTPSTNGVNYTQDSASLWVWSRTNATSSVTDMGEQVTAPDTRIITRNGSNQLGIRVNDGTSTSLAGVTDSTGFFGNQRSGASAIAGFRNGSSVGTGSVASTGLPAQELWLCGANSNGFSAKQQAAGAIGASLAGLESAFYTRMLTYMQAVGAA